MKRRKWKMWALVWDTGNIYDIYHMRKTAAKSRVQFVREHYPTIIPVEVIELPTRRKRK